MTPLGVLRPHPPSLEDSESGAEYLQCRQSVQQEEYGVYVGNTTLDYSQFLGMHLVPTAQVSLSSDRGNSGEALQFLEEDSVASPQSSHPPDCSDLSDILTESEGGRIILKLPPLEQDTVEESPESEPVETELLEIQQEIIDTRNSVCIKGFDNLRFFCYQNSVIQMLCASDSLREKLLDHVNPIDGGFQSIDFRGIHHFALPSCCAPEMCLICALGWVMVNHRFCEHESGPMGTSTTPLNGWVRDLRILSSYLGYTGVMQQDASEYLMEIINAMSNLGKFSKPIVDVLTGSYPSVVCCPKCNNQSVTGQELRMLQLHYPPTATGPAEVEDLIDTFFGAEKVDSTCDACLYKSEDSSFLKVIRVNHAPSFLVLSVARCYDVNSPKLMGALKIKEYLALWSDIGPVVYVLKAVICHQGSSVNGGHYTCFVQKPGQVWVSCNDHWVSEVSFEQIECLFYTQPVVLGYEKVSK